MIESLYSAASGMLVQQTGLDVIANNLANVNTAGFKRDRMDQVDLAYQPFRLPTGNEGQVGLGAGPGAIGKEMVQGIFTETGRSLDVAIQGEGFLQVTRPDGSLAFTRAGNLQVDGTGRVTLPGGEVLQPRVTIPPNASDITIGQDGAVTGKVDGAVTDLGRIQLAVFANPTGLQPIGGNLFLQTANSGVAQAGAPGTGGRGTLTAGYVEGSNVQMATEMIAMITAQRAFEASSRVVRASDEMWGMANMMRR